MNRALVDRVVNAVLYEGYILYPYRPSVKNRQRWTFGGLYPPAYSAAQGGSDPCSLQTECLVEGDGHTRVEATVRFLHLTARRVGELPEGCDSPARYVEALRVDGKLLQTWQEAEERTVALAETPLADLFAGPQTKGFAFPAGRRREEIRQASGKAVGVIDRQQQALQGTVEVAAAAVGERLFRLTVRVANTTVLENAGRADRDEALLYALVSTHVILGVQGGAFASLLDPPDRCRAAAEACRNVGVWPVLVGEEGERDTMLASPIILYDYPQVAPESPGDLFDGTEIDEILTLRILTLTEDEKQAAAAVDERARALLRRTEGLGAEELLRLHGTLRQAGAEGGHD
jgi:hydrogenase maturation protease